MAKSVGTLVVDLEANTAKFSRGMKDAESRGKKFGKALLSTGKLVGGLAAVGFAAFSAAAVKSALEAEESFSKFNTIFGNQAKEMEGFISDLQRTVPATATSLRQMTSGLQDLLVPMGLTPDLGADMSKQFVTLAADLASFNNVPIEQALEKLRAGLVGSSEPLLAYGVDVRQAAVKTKAFELGLVAEGEAVNNAARAQAVLAIAMEQSTFAMGDAARTAESTANQVRFLQRDLAEITETAGKSMMPAFTAVVSLLGELARTLAGNSEMMEMLGSAIAAPVQAFFFLQKKISEISAGFLEFTRSILQSVKSVNDLLGSWSPFSGIMEGVQKAIDTASIKILHAKDSAKEWEERQNKLNDALHSFQGEADVAANSTGNLATAMGEVEAEVGNLAADLAEFQKKQAAATKEINEAVVTLPLYGSRINTLNSLMSEGVGITNEYAQAHGLLTDEFIKSSGGLQTLGLAAGRVNNLNDMLDDGSKAADEYHKEWSKTTEALNTVSQATESLGSKIGEQISSISTDFSKAFVDILFEGGSFAEKMIGIFAELGKGLLRTVIEEIITPIIDQFAKFIAGIIGTVFKGAADVAAGGGVGGGGGGGGGGIGMPQASFTDLAITGVAIQTGIFGTGVAITGLQIQTGNFHTGVALTGVSIGFGKGGIPAGIDPNILAIKNELIFNHTPTFRHLEALNFNMEAALKQIESITRADISPKLERIARATEGTWYQLYHGAKVRVEQPITVNVSTQSQAGIGGAVGTAVSDANQAIVDTVRDAIRTNQSGLRNDIQQLAELR